MNTFTKTLSGAAFAAALTIGASAEPIKKPVAFAVHGETLRGTLYLPGGYQEGQKLPGVVVTGAWMTVKEQMPAVYANEMAKAGYAALIFDFRGWGESDGKRRQLENPRSKIADIGTAIDYFATRPEIDPARISGLGICASSGYMVAAATASSRLKSVALVAPWLHDAEIVEATYGGKDGVAKLIAAGREAEVKYRTTGTQAFLPAASLTDKTAIMFGVPYYTEANRGLIPAWRNQADPAFWEGWLSFDAIQYAPRLTQPLLIVHSEAAAIPQGAHRFFGKVKGQKSELWLHDVTQLDFYDRPEPVAKAVTAVTQHFAKTL
jgi:fermentation-respiration switch protein FrsA (DUF1100 family)